MTDNSHWDAAASAPRLTRIFEIGGKSVTLTSPVGVGLIDGAAWSMPELQKWAKVYQGQGLKVDENHIQQARYILAVIEDAKDRPSLDQLMKMAGGPAAPKFKQLATAAMELCGLLDWSAFSKAVEGNTPADEP